ncbi:MAG: L,D-transpeptidase family protein [Terriglobia bacterium]
MKLTSRIILLAVLLVCDIICCQAVSVNEQLVDRILVEKGIRKLTLYRGETAIRSYRIALGGQAIGQKECQGDQRTPEGRYVIDGRNKNSHFHWSLHVS